jgi:transcriptional regulator with GAF, ATPase, and Fis domain
MDEIGELPLDVQVKLLRVLQEREFERVGSHRTQQVDVRLVTATNRDLEQEVAAHRFRADLFYRLNVFPIRLPPLRERPSDIPLLVRHFLAQFQRKLAKPLKAVAPDSMARLERYAWPGNIRELENVIERACVLSQDRWWRSSTTSLRRPRRPRAGSPARPDATLTLEEGAVTYPTGARGDGRPGVRQDGAAALSACPEHPALRMKKLGITRQRR